MLRHLENPRLLVNLMPPWHRSLLLAWLCLWVVHSGGKVFIVFFANRIWLVLNIACSGIAICNIGYICNVIRANKLMGSEIIVFFNVHRVNWKRCTLQKNRLFVLLNISPRSIWLGEASCSMDLHHQIIRNVCQTNNIVILSDNINIFRI